jgi:AbrB family looped-hinge helix DNA binding protein
MSESGVRIQEKGQVTIPYRIRKKLNLKRGDLVIFVETDSGVMVKPASVIAADEIETLVNDAIRDVREKRP